MGYELDIDIDTRYTVEKPLQPWIVEFDGGAVVSVTARTRDAAMNEARKILRKSSTFTVHIQANGRIVKAYKLP